MFPALSYGLHFFSPVGWVLCSWTTMYTYIRWPMSGNELLTSLVTETGPFSFSYLLLVECEFPFEKIHPSRNI